MRLAEEFCQLLKKNKTVFQDIICADGGRRIELPYSGGNGSVIKITFYFEPQGDIKISARGIYKLKRLAYLDNVLLMLNQFNARFPYARLSVSGREVVENYTVFGYLSPAPQGLERIFNYLAKMLSALKYELLLGELCWGAQE
ncbi:MAG TPA: hypothetical protein H9664_01480 [Firmicutes bacterium]|nr:hypothetical protein [Bacillota bacterium]